ncbi:putative bifunctional diguanylate cyclase/phosphodiesterase [Paraglaciecola aestuariivivens]
MVVKQRYFNPKREWFIALTIILTIYITFIFTDFMGYWFALTAPYEAYQLDELIGLVIGTSLSLLFITFKLSKHYKIDRQRIKELSKELHYQVNHDRLTGLPNRFAFKAYTQDLIEVAKSQHSNFTLFYVDLDSFKYINDMLGYSVGDKILIETANRLNSVIDGQAMLSRIGGDEFCIIQPGPTSDEMCLKICTELNQKMSESFCVAGHKLQVSQTIGISRFPQDGDSYEKLLRIADIAMFMGKRSGQGQNNFKDGNFIENMQRRFIIQHGLNDAIKLKELFLVYQPKIELSSGQTVGAEALVRWRHPVHGLISPNEFINVAEEIYAVHLIDLYVLEMVCAQIQLWGDKAKPVAVNFSPVLFADESSTEKVFALLNKYQVPHHLIKLEITERTIAADSVIPLLVCKRLSEAGIEISLDDFGTGYSSLSHIADYPISELKLDRSFINQICENQKTRNIVSSIINLSKALNINVVAEGIETIAQLNLVTELGCSLAQGYYIDKPLTLEQFSLQLEQANSTA